MLVKTFRGLIVKKMRRVSGGILLTFLSPTAGERGKQLLISQADWDQFGLCTYERKTPRAILRKRRPPE